MMVLVSYDVSTVDAMGKRRLRRVAKVCLDFGQRVQNSVFECIVDPALLAQLRDRLEKIIDIEKDSLRYYYLGDEWQKRVEHVGAKPGMDLEGTLMV